MIGRVAGRVDYRGADHVLVDTGGVGYVVYCSDRTLAALPGPGEGVALFVETVVREDAITLYGFQTLAEKEWHRLLTSVQGIGAKVALAILGTLGTDGVGRAIALGDAASVRAAPGVGPKTANRVVMELKDKAPAVMALGAQGAAPAAAPMAPPAAADTPSPPEAAPAPEGLASARADALSALANLGYGPGEAASALAEAEAEGATDTATLIRAALRRLAPGG